MLLPMRRIDVIAPHRQLQSVLRLLHRVGVVHLVPFEPPAGPGATIFDAYPSSIDTSAEQRCLDWLSELATWLGPAEVRPVPTAELWALDQHSLNERLTAMAQVHRLAQELATERALAQAERSGFERLRELAEGLRRTMDRLPVPPGYGVAAVVLPSRVRGALDALCDEVTELTTGRCGMVVCDLDPDRAAGVIVYPTRYGGDLQRLLGGRQVDWYAVPEGLACVPFDELLPKLTEEVERSRARADRTQTGLAALAAEHASTVAALQLVLGDRVSEAKAVGEAGASDHIVVLSGWVPAHRLSALRSALGPNVAVAERELTRGELEGAPVALENRRVIRAFEPLASFVSFPRYGSLDPTPALALTFPLFFGLMVGDAAYGLLLLGLLVWAHRRWRGRPFMSVLWPVGFLATVATIGFGILYGEWFGGTGRAVLGLRPLWLDRQEAIQSLLLLAIGIGVLQVGLGLALGAVNAARLGQRRNLVARATQLTSLAAILVVLGWMAAFVAPPAGCAALVVLGIGLVILAATLGLAGPVEMLTIVGNVLSYTRLMAIGLASVMLAVVANRLGELPGSLLLGLAVAGSLHLLNIVLGTFDATVQGLRLHYVEFFTKFVEPGYVRYAPFASALDLANRGLGLSSEGGP